MNRLNLSQITGALAVLALGTGGALLTGAAIDAIALPVLAGVIVLAIAARGDPTPTVEMADPVRTPPDPLDDPVFTAMLEGISDPLLLVERGRIAEETEPRAKSVRYDRKSGRVIVDLKNDCTFSFPARLAQGLENATDDELAEVEVLGRGYGLHWETLNEDHAIPALVAGIFGTRKYMAALAGRSKSPAKAAAARANGAKGGRPRKSA